MPTTVKKTTAATKGKAPQPAPKPVAKTQPAGRGTAVKMAPAKPAPQTTLELEPTPEQEQDQEIVYEEVAQTDTPPAGDVAFDGGEVDTAAENDLIPTPQVKLPPPNPTAHKATITGFERKDFDSGAVAAQVKLHFDDNDREDNYTIFLPALFVSNFSEVVADPEGTLPNEPADEERQIKGNMQLNQYLRNVASGDRTAVCQKLMSIAAEQNHTRKSLGITDIPDSIDGWFDITASILVGVEVIALCRKDRNAQDPAFANMLRVQGVLAPSVLDDPKQKVLKPFNGKSGYVFAWEQ